MIVKDGPENMNDQCSPTFADFLKEKMGLCKMAFAEVAPRGTEALNPAIVNSSEEVKENVANSSLAKGAGADKLNDLRQSRQAQFDAIFKNDPS